MALDKVINKGARSIVNKDKGEVNNTKDFMRSPSPFEIPDEVKEELRSKQFKPRWIDIGQLKSKGGYHKNGWTPVQFDCLKGRSAKNPFLDSAMDGYLVRNGMILAVNSDEEVAALKLQKTRRTAAQSSLQASEDFKQHVRGLKGAKLIEGDE